MAFKRRNKLRPETVESMELCSPKKRKEAASWARLQKRE